MIGELFGVMWLFLGIIFVFAKKDIITVAACFITYGILSGSTELYLIRKELENKEDKEDE